MTIGNWVINKFRENQDHEINKYIDLELIIDEKRVKEVEEFVYFFNGLIFLQIS